MRRRRGGLEESALIDKETYDDAIEPIFNMPRTTMTGEIDPEELNGQINRYSTSGKLIAPLCGDTYRSVGELIDMRCKSSA